MPYSSYSNFKNFSNDDLKLMANTVRTLSIDMIEQANSGHPGTPLGIADVLTVLFAKFIKFDVKDAKWINRDRFILSAGHASAVLYSLFYLLGYEDIKLEDLKNFRQLHSKAAGHPEYGFFNATEVTTGPLGQGIANGVGISIAKNILTAKFGEQLINHKTFVLAGDGCFMEGISYEAMALAGHLGLSDLIYIYDKNNITIDGKLSLAESTDFVKRFTSMGFNVFECNGHNYYTIEAAINLAINSNNGKPNIIITETKIGFSSLKEGSEKSHGSPIGKEDISRIKKAFELEDTPFFVNEKALKLWQEVGKLSSENRIEWNKKLEHYNKKAEFLKTTSGISSLEVSKIVNDFKKTFETKREEKATRQHGSAVLLKFTEHFSTLIGGSADLSESNGAKNKFSKVIQNGQFSGNYIHYGIREHAMTAIMNGIALHSCFSVYGSTFLVFSDYMRPAIRLAAIMKLPTIYVLTHDSIFVGEDGPTHQPVEHLTALRIIPNLNVIRPADSIETLEAFEFAISSKTSPSAIALSRQTVKELTPLRSENLVSKGFYYAFKAENENLTIYASGSEVSLAFDVKSKLLEKGIKASIVSMPCFEAFEKQTEEYKSFILNAKKRIFIEAGIMGNLAKYIKEGDLFFGIETFGESGKPLEVAKHFGLTAENIINKIIASN